MIKSVSEIRTDESGRQFKVTRKIKMRLVTESVEPEVAFRRTWKKFGLAANDGPGPNMSSTILGEPVFLKLGMDTDFDKQEVSPAQAQATEAKTLKCKYCDGPHFSVKCPYKDTFAGEASKPKLNDSGASEGSSAASAPEGPGGSSKYVPKFKRSTEEGGNGPQSPSGTDSTLDDRDQGLAIRITKEDAETVMRRLNGFPYGNMILKVEIARPIDK